MNLTLSVGVLCCSLFWYALLYVLSRFCIHLDEEERAGCFDYILFRCLVTVDVLWLFGAVGWSIVCDIILSFS